MASFLKKLGKVIGGGLKLIGKTGIPILSQAASLGGSILSGGNMKDHVGAVAGSVLPNIAGGGIKLPGVVGDAAGDVGSWVKKNPELVLGGLSGLEGWRNDRRARRIENEIAARENAQRSRFEPLQGQGLKLMTAMERPDLSYITDQSINPYTRRRAQ